jgi:chromosome segregation ATPase
MFDDVDTLKGVLEMNEFYREIDERIAELKLNYEKEEKTEGPTVDFKKTRLFNMDGSPVNRPKTTQAVIDGFAKILDAQDDKGIKKYGTTMDEAIDENYDWRIMALEETADLQKYLVKEIKRLENLVKSHEEVGQGYHQEIVELVQEIEKWKDKKVKIEKERDEFKKQFVKAHAEIQDLQYQKKILAEQLTLATSGEKKNHDCHKNQAIHWQGKDIVKVKCLICDKILYQA